MHGMRNSNNSSRPKPNVKNGGSLVISGVLNYLIFKANKAYPDRSSAIRWNKCLTFRIRCSSATTLIMQWLEFSGQEFSKRPDMISQSSGHARGAVAPLGPDQPRGGWFLLRQRYTQTHMRPGEVVEGLKEN